MSKIILVTGASSGFGKAIATKFAAGGWNVILTGRRKEKLDALAKGLEANYGIKHCASTLMYKIKKQYLTIYKTYLPSGKPSTYW
jgi:NADP-dependent 3-hydroxy acid dehydrogenase YdfG